MSDAATLFERLRANDPDYWRIGIPELDQSNSELLNLIAALENNTVVSDMLLDISIFTEESALAMGKFLRSRNSLKKVVLGRAVAFGDAHREQHRIIFCILLRALLCSKTVKDVQLEGIALANCGKDFANLLSSLKSLHKLCLFWVDAELGSEAAITIAKTLTESSTVKDLSLVEWPESSLTPFLTGLQNHFVLELLELGNVQSLTGLDVLLQSENCGITELFIARHRTEPTIWDNRALPTLEPLFRGINRNSTVRQLTVKDYILGLDQAEQLKRLLRQNTLISFLDVSGASLGSAGLAEIAAGLYRNTTLTRLEISNNALGDVDSAKTLKDLLRRNKSLTVLWIQKNSFGSSPSAVRCIAQGLRENKSLHSIDLSHCMLGDRGVSVLANGLGSSNKTLKDLFVSDNQITATGLGELLELVGSKLPISKLDLAGNPLRAEGANVLANALEQNTIPHLKKVWIERCGVGDDGLERIASALEQNRTLEVMALQGNIFGEPGLRALAKSLPNIQALDYLDMTWNASFTSCMPILMKGLRENKSLRDVHIGGLVKGKWAQELELLQYRNRFHCLLKTPPDTPLDPEQNIGTWSRALARVSARPDVLFHVLCSKPQLVRPVSSKPKERKRKRDESDENDSSGRTPPVACETQALTEGNSQR
jgi:Ran GTPase-activating protein (RanGAP) involved in mRNA processing and transport